SALCSLFTVAVCADDAVSETQSQEDSSVQTELEDHSLFFDGFLNVKMAHERNNDYAFGKKNSSAIGFTPVFKIGALQFESDFYYGRQFTFTGFCKGASNFSRIAGDLPYFYENYNGQMRKTISDVTSNDLDNPHFYRNYSRITYANKQHDFRVVVGDTAVRNTIGFQQVLSGAGISIFRQGGNGSEINGGLPIVITRLSKVECKLGDEILCVKILPPGLYTVNDLVEEAKLPGVTLKISDQLSRSETLSVNYFSGYDMPAEGKDDFDVTVVCPHQWDLESQHRMRYRKKPRYSTNYRYGYTDDITLAAGAQISENDGIFDVVTIFNSQYGKFAPNVAFSTTKECGHTTGAGFYYALPKNDMGVHLEAFFAAKEKGFGDLGTGEELENAYNEFIDKYFSDNAPLVEKLHNSSGASSARQIITRLYSDPICGITPAFIFNGEWSSSQRLREYTLSMTTKLFDCLTVTLSGGLTYDDPSKGRNQKSPDRRLTAACCWDIGSELTVKGTYSHYDEEKRRAYCLITYTPEEIKGLELSAERTSRPGLSNPVFTVKYDNEYFNIKVDEGITNTYQDNEANTIDKHTNRQRFYFGTSLSPKGFKAHRKSSFNVARDL
nr:hypothetical protein [Alphaproteobacteria bacterium]